MRPRSLARAAALVVGLVIVLGAAAAMPALGAAAPAAARSRPAATTRSARASAPRARPVAVVRLEPLGPGYDTPGHGVSDAIVYGGEAEFRFASDRVQGVGNPDWASVQRVAGFGRARLGSRLHLVGGVAYDRATDDLIIERALVVARVRANLDAQAGILPIPLGGANLEHDATRSEFNQRSLVATELVGVPNSQLGAGVRGVRRPARGHALSYEVDLVTGYDDGVINDSPSGTRLPRGRNNALDNNGVPALVGRVAVELSPDTELGLSALSGPYNQRRVGGVIVDRSRGAMIVLADGVTRAAGFRLAGEAAIAHVDVPPGLEGLFAERQWGGSIEVARTLRDPIVTSWSGSSLGAALRVDALDFDRAIPGDSNTRIAASLNLRPQPAGVIRFGWYYELRRDRFNNDVRAAGLTLSVATRL